MRQWCALLRLTGWDEGQDVRVVVVEAKNEDLARVKAEQVAAFWNENDPRCQVNDDAPWWNVDDVGAALTGTADDLGATLASDWGGVAFARRVER